MPTSAALDSVSIVLPFAASSAGVARRQLLTWLSGLGAPEDLQEDGRLVLSELVGNAVRHASPLHDGTMVVGLSSRPEGVEISVTDGGSRTRPAALDAPVSALGGRGLSIVETLAAHWWTETEVARTSVHALLAL